MDPILSEYGWTIEEFNRTDLVELTGLINALSLRRQDERKQLKALNG